MKPKCGDGVQDSAIFGVNFGFNLNASVNLDLIEHEFDVREAQDFALLASD